MKSIKVIIFSLTLLLLFSNYKIFHSSSIQSYLMDDFNNETYFVPIEFSNKIDVNYPNVTITALPIKLIVGRYYDRLDPEKAKKLYIEAMSNNINPYIKAPEAYLSRLYLNEKQYDSSLYYSKIAFNTQPNNNLHRYLYFKNLEIKKDSIALEIAFKKLKNTGSQDHWLNYMLSRYQIVGPTKAQSDKNLSSVISEYENNFVDGQDIETFKKFISFGEDEIQQSLNLSLAAEAAFNEKKYEQAANLYILSSKIDPTEYTFFENAAISFNLAGNFSEAIKNFDKVIYNIKPGDGKSEFYKGIMLIKIDSLKKGCNYLYKAVKFNYAGNSSLTAYKNFCN